jgi:hypothetical protein
MSIIKCWLLPFVLLAQLVVCNAHQDRVLSLKEGKLVGLPEEYLPAEYDVAKKKLRIRNHEMIFSSYLSSFFPEGNEYELKITASWYHERRDILPPYISFKIEPIGKDFSYNMLINLENLELINLFVEVRESKNLTRWLPIDVSLYSKEIKKSRRLVAPELRLETPEPADLPDPFATES